MVSGDRKDVGSVGTRSTMSVGVTRVEGRIVKYVVSKVYTTGLDGPGRISKGFTMGTIRP